MALRNIFVGDLFSVVGKQTARLSGVAYPGQAARVTGDVHEFWEWPQTGMFGLLAHSDHYWTRSGEIAAATLHDTEMNDYE